MYTETIKKEAVRLREMEGIGGRKGKEESNVILFLLKCIKNKNEIKIICHS